MKSPFSKILENGKGDPTQNFGEGETLEVKDFPSELHEKRFVIESNLLRRQLTTFQRVEMAKPLLEIEKELAKERQLSQNFGGVGR